MKSKFLMILLVLNVLYASAQVPNSTTFTLQNVVDVVNPTTDDLQDCFSDAISSYFDPTYSGSKTSLLNFRNYGPHNSCPSFVTSNSFFTTTGTTVTVNTPAANAGDILIILLSQQGNSTITPPAGWTNTSVPAPSSTTVNGNAIYKIITSTTAAGTVSITSAAASNKCAAIMKFSGGSLSVTRYEGFSSSTTYSSRNLGAYSGTSCKMSLAVLFALGNIAPTPQPTTGWTWAYSSSTSDAGGWGLAVQTYLYDASETSPDTDFALSPATYICEMGILID